MGLRLGEQMMSFHVYLLRSRKDHGFYIGQTQDLAKRLAQHNAGQVMSTRGRIPLDLVGSEEYKTRDEARFREFDVKHHSDKKKVFTAKLISGQD